MTTPAQAFLDSLQQGEPEDAADALEEGLDGAGDEEAASPETANDALESEQSEDILQGVDALREEVSGRSDTISTLLDWLDAIGFSVGDTRFSVLSAVVLLLVVFSVFVMARMGEGLGRMVLRRMRSLDPSRMVLADKLISVVVWTLAILIGIDLLGLDLTALAVFSGALGLAVGFGLQKTFGNLIAGIILLMDRSIKPGDVIAIADQAGQQVFGQIREIGIRAVSITTRDEREYLIPNENLMINQVENWSYSSRKVRFQIPVGVSYNSDMALAEKLMIEAAKSAPRVLDTPPPTVWMANFGDSSVDFVIHCWITDPEDGIGNIRSSVLKKLWDLFAENNIEIPFPQRDLNLRDNEQFQQLVAAITQRIESGVSKPSDEPAPAKDEE
ncbi:MAG: mechanosensitive ion channel family protein [Erythrobacter sp.]